MPFITRIVGPDEKLLGIARLHWMYAARGLLWLVGLMILGVATKFLLSGLFGGALEAIGQAVFWISTIIGALLFMFYFIMMSFTELGLTTQRAIYKRGMIFVDVREIDLEEIKSASVDHGYLGSILNYGYLDLDARFIEDISLPAIADPYRFVKALNEVREKIKEDSMHVVLDQKGAGAIKTKDDLNNPDKEGEPSAQMRHGDANPKHMSDARYDTDIETLMEDGSNSNGRQNKRDVKPKSKNDDPLNKTMKEHLSEKIIDDFDDAEQK